MRRSIYQNKSKNDNEEELEMTRQKSPGEFFNFISYNKKRNVQHLNMIFNGEFTHNDKFYKKYNHLLHNVTALIPTFHHCYNQLHPNYTKIFCSR
jgi:hypothetical protein